MRNTPEWRNRNGDNLVEIQHIYGGLFEGEGEEIWDHAFIDL